ncbi:MAG: carboxymuconolactone decarboxylase family protein [Micropruina sp.]|uniref:carboxymuconolactone decarboxylase family protein n=1 Tax=Micropruina sp. TaxID=2737536 RepID=UPI0039E43EE9
MNTTPHPTPPLVSVTPGPGTEWEARRRLARVPIDPPAGPFGRLLTWACRRMYGRPLDNAHAMAFNRRVLLATFAYERRVAKFDRLDPGLKALATMAAAAEIGCTWCIDFGYHLAHTEGLDLAKLAAVPNWSTAENLTVLEKQVIEFAVAATRTPTEVTDAMVAPLRATLGDAGLIELAMIVAIENQRSRFNSTLGLVSQGFSASCQLPSAE